MTGRAITAARIARKSADQFRPQPDLVAVLQRDDAEAVVLQLVQPSVADRDLRREHGAEQVG